MVTIQHRIILSPFKRQSTNQYMIVSCVYQISVWTRSQILMLRSKPFTIASLFYSLCNAMIFSCKVFFSLHFGNKSLSLLPRRAAVFLWSHAFFLFCFLFLLLLFFFLGGGVEIKDKLLWIPRVLLIGNSLGLFLSAEMSMPSAANIEIIKLDSISQLILAVPTVRFWCQIITIVEPPIALRKRIHLFTHVQANQ